MGGERERAGKGARSHRFHNRPPPTSPPSPGPLTLSPLSLSRPGLEAELAALKAHPAIAAVLAGAASLASAASTSVMLYRHANIDKVTSRAARNVAVSLMGGSDTQKKERGESGPRMPSRARAARGRAHGREGPGGEYAPPASRSPRTRTWSCMLFPSPERAGAGEARKAVGRGRPP